MVGITLDTGALIALERRERRMRDILSAARASFARVSVPAAVLIEWWRDAPRQHAILVGLDIANVTERVAKSAGAALVSVPGASVVDAAVMAYAAQRGDMVYTSDVGDLQRLQAHFPSVRVLGVSGR